jgi:hypothetical protein
MNECRHEFGMRMLTDPPNYMRILKKAAAGGRAEDP